MSSPKARRLLGKFLTVEGSLADNRHVRGSIWSYTEPGIFGSWDTHGGLLRVTRGACGVWVRSGYQVVGPVSVVVFLVVVCVFQILGSRHEVGVVAA